MKPTIKKAKKAESKIEIIKDANFKVRKAPQFMKISHCAAFNVTVYGFGPFTSENDATEFKTIEQLQDYIDMLQKAADELRSMRGK